MGEGMGWNSERDRDKIAMAFEKILQFVFFGIPDPDAVVFILPKNQFPRPKT